MRSIGKSLIVALALSFGTASAILPADAGKFSLIKMGNGYMKWGAPALGAGAVITYSFVRDDMSFQQARNCRAMSAADGLLDRSGLEQADFRNAFKAAAAMWERAANVRFRYERNPDEAQILIGAQSKPRGRAYANVEFDAVPRTVGLGLLSIVPRKVATDFNLEELPIQALTRSLICLNPEVEWKTGFDGDMTRYDLRHTLAHELGHAIGLNHAGPAGQIMSFRYSEDRSELQTGDVEGVRLLYGDPQVRIANTGPAETDPASGMTVAASAD